MNYSQYLPQVVSAIKEYGILVNVYRDIYEDVVGCKTLVEPKKLIHTLSVVIDNSKSSSQYNRNDYTNSGISHLRQSATVYFAYDSGYDIKHGDYIIVGNLKYKLDTPQDIAHVHLVYQCNAEVGVENE